MRLRHILFAASLLFPAAAHADTFNTTITGGGNTIFFPNIGGPSNYQLFPRVNEDYASPIYVYVNGGARTQGSLTFFYAGSGPIYLDLFVLVPLDSTQFLYLYLYGPNLLSGSPGSFYSFPGTYNLTDGTGTPYTYVVTDDILSAVPEPSTLSLLAIGATCLLSLRSRRPVTPVQPI